MKKGIFKALFKGTYCTYRLGAETVIVLTVSIKTVRDKELLAICSKEKAFFLKLVSPHQVGPNIGKKPSRHMASKCHDVISTLCVCWEM